MALWVGSRPLVQGVGQTGACSTRELAPASEKRPTGKTLEVDFCTVARWENGEIVEEKLFYDVVGLMRQIGVGS